MPPPRKFEIRSSKTTGNAPKTRILLILSLSMGIHLYSAVLDPDLEITGGGRVGVGERPVSKKKFFGPLSLSLV